jgi:hypothetical protein
LPCAGWTPIFEWCSKTNLIVLSYESDQLVLTAMRNMKTGRYMSYAELVIEHIVLVDDLSDNGYSRRKKQQKFTMFHWSKCTAELARQIL